MAGTLLPGQLVISELDVKLHSERRDRPYSTSSILYFARLSTNASACAPVSRETGAQNLAPSNAVITPIRPGSVSLDDGSIRISFCQQKLEVPHCHRTSREEGISSMLYLDLFQRENLCAETR